MKVFLLEFTYVGIALLAGGFAGYFVISNIPNFLFMNYVLGFWAGLFAIAMVEHSFYDIFTPFINKAEIEEIKKKYKDDTLR